MGAGDPIYASDFAVLARGRRTTNTAAVTTTETGVLRVDGVPVLANRAYLVMLPSINMDSSVTGDLITASIRVSTSGAATTASTRIGMLRNVDPGTSPVFSTFAYFFPTADGTASFLLSFVRTTGTGNVFMFYSATDYLDMIVAGYGLAPADTGVVI